MITEARKLRRTDLFVLFTAAADLTESTGTTFGGKLVRMDTDEDDNTFTTCVSAQLGDRSVCFRLLTCIFIMHCTSPRTPCESHIAHTRSLRAVCCCLGTWDFDSDTVDLFFFGARVRT
jgi:hypothetical protein